MGLVPPSLRSGSTPAERNIRRDGRERGGSLPASHPLERRARRSYMRPPNESPAAPGATQGNRPISSGSVFLGSGGREGDSSGSGTS
jgi:hypothetical protein